MSISFYYQNTRGLRTKAQQFFDNVVLFDHDVYCITETWLSDQIASTDYFPDEYAVFRHDRDYERTGQKYGGGALIALRKSMVAFRRADLELGNECVWVETKTNRGKNLLIGVYYMHPTLDFPAFASVFQHLSESIDPGKYNILLFGDFNVPGQWWNPGENVGNSTKAAHLFNFFSFAGLAYAALPPNPAGNVLDIVFSNLTSLDLKQAREALVPVDPWHEPFTVTALLPVAYELRMETPSFDFPRGDYNALYITLQETNWEPVYTSHNADAAVQLLTKIVQKAMDEHIPKKSKRPHQFPFWFSKELRSALRSKRRFHKLRKAKNDTSADTNFKEQRSLVKVLLARDKKHFSDFTESSLTRSPSDFWRIFSTRTRKAPERITLQDGDTIVSDPASIVEIFTKHFLSAYSSSRDSGFPLRLAQIGDVIHTPNITVEDVTAAIRSLPSKKSSGHDNIPCFIVKGCSAIFAPLLCHIFCLSLEERHFPTNWKPGVVFPLHKSGNASVPGNYRPISLLCSFSKVFEKVVHRYLLSKIRPLIHSNQHGFIPARSVESNLACFLSDASKYILSRQQMDAIYFDCSKAFDRVNHDLLLRKLSAYGLAPAFCEWFATYLKQRTNFVQYAGAKSRSFTVPSGVPQGSILGPLLFNLFVNDVQLIIKHSSLLQFADDMKLYRAVGSQADCAQLQRDVQAISLWCKTNYLDLNPLKTVTITYTRKTSPLTFPYHLDSLTIRRVSETRDLGVLMDSKLRFTPHVNYLARSSLRTLGAISRATRDFSGGSCFLALYKALVLPKLEFASAVWNCMSASSSLRLERVQKRFTRIFSRRYTLHEKYAYKDVIKRLKLEELQSRRTNRDLVFLFKCIHSGFDSPKLVSSVRLRAPSRALRPHLCFDVTTSEMLSPVCRVQRVYNDDFRASLDVFSGNVNSFKRALKNACV